MNQNQNFTGWGENDTIEISENFLESYHFTPGTQNFLKTYGLPSQIAGWTFDRRSLTQGTIAHAGHPIIGYTPQDDPILLQQSLRNPVGYLPNNLANQIAFLNSSLQQFALALLRAESFEKTFTSLSGKHPPTEFEDIQYNVFQLDLLEIDRPIFTQTPSYWIGHLEYVLANRNHARSHSSS